MKKTEMRNVGLGLEEDWRRKERRRKERKKLHSEEENQLTHSLGYFGVSVHVCVSV